MTDQKTTIKMLRERVRRFVAARDWEQFHSAKNLSMSIAIETAELMEHFQWEDASDMKPFSPSRRREIEHELADIVVYALDFCNMMKIDLSSAIERKMRLNEKKYPVRRARGKSQKYTHYLSDRKKR